MWTSSTSRARLNIMRAMRSPRRRRASRYFVKSRWASMSRNRRKLVETIEGMGARNAVNFSFAASPSRAFLRSQLADGAFGTIDAIDIRLHFATWPRGWQEAAAWLGKRRQGGYVREVLSHFIYLTESVFGPLTRRASHGRAIPTASTAVRRKVMSMPT